ncbi:transcriptional regulator GlxA family with amidase domain [Microbacterium endophyticum]|uniref:Transcriptional regulator GlxA family with amidase domain n=1 Tax=Microbacterium endophyticum TaxID=1526412 RepID=A0A7W4YPH6_9MICO|nr:helix-turn-helix domain-containing protein [Microbacterium endophyticum]MBB2977152.1 transcriptional regulator GlxA family with amidase domain [Microbacterium endophyticum]NIK36080.1 transcriptional regulator GlxA family with amidase domain [Microbacterium endophyticum]
MGASTAAFDHVSHMTTTRRAQLRARALQVISEQCWHPQFDEDALAGVLDVSRKTLDRTFSEGESVAYAIGRARVQRVRRSLLCGQCRSVRVASEAAGFTSLGAMKFHFRRVFDETPLQLQRRLRHQENDVSSAPRWSHGATGAWL